MHALFYTRLALYLLLAGTPALHPAVAVPYDRTALYTLFGMIPAAMFAAYYGRAEGRKRWWAVGAAFLAFGLVFVTGFRPDAWYLLTGALLSFAWTRVVFARLLRLPVLASLEIFAFGFTYFKILSFARASADVAGSTSGITSLLLALTIIAFCAHACVVYLAAFPGKPGQLKRVFLGGAAASVILLAVAYLVPADFVAHNIVMNELEDEPPLNPTDLSGEPIDERPGRGGRPEQEEQNSKNGLPLGDRDEKYPSELQNGGRPREDGQQERQGQGGQRGDQRNDQRNRNRQDQGGQGQNQQDRQSRGGQGQDQGPKLEGVPQDQWNNRNQNGQGDGKQSAVMVIASPVQPVYAAESYNAKFTADRAFIPDPADEELNILSTQRLLQTWRNDQELQDQFRRPVEIFYFSTIETRALAFRPIAIEPTIQDKRYRPFNLSYLALSAMSMTGPDEWLAAGNMSSIERDQTALYLDVPRDDPRIERIRGRVKDIVKGREWHFQKIEAILKSFKTHRYEMGFDEEMSLAKLETFLFTEKKGDCTEFSQTAALMGRLAGIPSRAVSGYIASRDLQTRAHRGGVYQIRKRVPALQKYKMEDLYLVTTSHHHAWVQFYIPKIGWVDFETTSYAIPPEPKFDPNQQDVLIPMIEEVPQTPEEKFKFPYRFVGKVLAIAAAILTALLYLYRWARIAFLVLASRRDTPHGLDSLFRLLILRLAHEGNDVRPPFQTHREYASRFARLVPFAGRFTELRFHPAMSAEDRRVSHALLIEEYHAAVAASRRTGLFAWLRRYFSLKGIWI